MKNSIHNLDRLRFFLKQSVVHQWLNIPFDFFNLRNAVNNYAKYLKDMIKYSDNENSEQINFKNVFPCVNEKTNLTHFDAHYFYQDIWAFKKIQSIVPKSHVDVGSRIDFIGFLTAITNVTFIDIRPLNAKLENFISKEGDILNIPYRTGTVESLSCLHVAEHIGLGRYGDPLDPLGTQKACAELSRVLAPSGNLYFSVPVGKPRLCFNAHRIHSVKKILEYFKNLELIEFSGVDDAGNFMENINTSIFKNSKYACGLFHFRKNGE